MSEGSAPASVTTRDPDSPGQRQDSRRRHFWLRLLLGLLVLSVVLIRADWERLLEVLSAPIWSFLIMSVLLQALAKVVWVFRWKEVLAASGIYRSFTDLLALILIGIFFGTFLPSTVGSDLVRGYYAARDREQLIPSYAVVLIERVLGLVTLAMVAGGSAALGLMIGGFPRTLLVWVVTISAVITLAGCTAFAWRGWARWLPSPSQGRGIGRAVGGIMAGLALFWRPDARRLRIVAASFALQLAAVGFYWSCARAVAIDLPTLLFFVLVPIAMLVAAIPLTLNGLGLREGAFVGLFVMQGVDSARAGAFVVLALLVATVFSIAGGFVYPFYRRSTEETSGVTSTA